MSKPCAEYEPCGCSGSHDGHCLMCCKAPDEHGPEAVREWEAERARRQARRAARAHEVPISSEARASNPARDLAYPPMFPELR